MSLVRATKESEAGLPPNPALMAAIGKLAEEAVSEGVMVGMAGLAPSSKGARVRASGGKVTVVDGPFAEIKELIAGYAILEVNSREEAIEQARRFMQVHLDALGPSYEGECEVRQIFGGQGRP
ncbi:MAG: YciI family protein [Bryobacteraceae bacterium]